MARFTGRFLFKREIWREFQAAGVGWAPERRPEENISDPHWRARGAFIDVEHPELGEAFAEVGAKWVCPQVGWGGGAQRRAPLLGEHNDEVLDQLNVHIVKSHREPRHAARVLSKRGMPFALEGTHFLDLTWLLASGGAGRFLSGFGAEVIKVEHSSRWDFIRFPAAVTHRRIVKGEEYDGVVLEELKPEEGNPNRSGLFMDINAGKRSISLNLKHPKGREILTRLIQWADVLAEGFTPGTMDRMGFGYEQLREINPRLVYVQQSGTGKAGSYGEMRSVGPTAQAFSGLSEMSGLPEPYPPAGIGYSFLDWYGAYNVAAAIMAGLYRQKLTGQGCWIDASQVEAGIYISGTAILDSSANSRRWSRYGNRSPYKLGAPHGVYRARGEDHWIAIACFTEEEWGGLLRVVGSPSWGRDDRFSTLTKRISHQEELDALVNSATEDCDGYDLMSKLQMQVFQPESVKRLRIALELDPQLRHLDWLVDLTQTEIGTWPVKECPVN